MSQLGFNPLDVQCRNCWAASGQSCKWAPSQEPPPQFHAERIEDAEFAAAISAELNGNAADPEAWKHAVDKAVGDLI